MPEETVLNEQSPQVQIEAKLSHLDSILARLESESDVYAGTGKWPEWWQEIIDSRLLPDITSELGSRPSLSSYISAYFPLFKRYMLLQEKISGHVGQTDIFGVFLIYLKDRALVKGAFTQEEEDGPLHAEILNSLDIPEDDPWAHIDSELEFLVEAYNLSSATELLSIKGEGFADKLHRFLRERVVLSRIRHDDLGWKPDPELRYDKIQHANNIWSARALSACVGIPINEATDYTFSSSRQDHDCENIESVIDMFEHFGTERIRKISETCGIHGLEGYSIVQLERMERLVLEPTEVAEELASRDVTVVLTNRAGDHNGILKDDAQLYDDETGRVLFFEISSPSDIYRYMIMLNKIGIRPSTLALAAHAAPGQFSITDLREGSGSPRHVTAIASRQLVEMVNTNNLEPGVLGYSAHGMAGLARVVETMMQPSRAIDDPDADLGRKKIIFQACYAAAEVPMSGIDNNGEKTQIGEESLITQIANDLRQSGVADGVDIYGAEEGIQTHKDEKGIHYSSRPKEWDLEPVRPLTHAIRVRIQNGQIIKETVERIPLNK